MDMDESEKIYRLESACLTNALRVAFVQGEGTQENPCRLMWRFYLLDGRYIGEIPADASFTGDSGRSVLIGSSATN